MNVHCPPGCVKIDQYGCILCACGVAMFHPGGYYGMPGGMSGAMGGFQPGSLGGGSFNSMKAKEKPLKDCPGTMLCMMSCKSKYSLGKVDNNGCRTCTCPTQHVATHHTSSSSYHASQPQHTSHAVVVQVQAPAPKTCMATELCKAACTTGYSLGQRGHDGCQSCTCLAPPTTPAPQHLSCPKTIECMVNCKEGYTLGSAGPDGCPECSCTHEVIVMELKCPSRLSCNSGCNVGYSCDDQGCPTCKCIEPHVVGLSVVKVVPQAVKCPNAFSCPKACKLGYKCGTDGCPTCECLIAVQGMNRMLGGGSGGKLDVQTIIKKCPTTMKCMTTCPSGYQLGGADKDGCPKCTCLGKETEVMTGLPHQETLNGQNTCPHVDRCMSSCSQGYTLGGNDANGCPTCTCARKEECHECEETHVVQVVPAKTDECHECEETKPVVVVQQTHNECHDCETGSGTAVATSGGSSGGMSSGGMGSGGPFSAGASGGFSGGAGGFSGGASMSGGGGQCQPLPPNCHPHCIKYDVAHCRYCMCESGKCYCERHITLSSKFGRTSLRSQMLIFPKYFHFHMLNLTYKQNIIRDFMIIPRP
ncbi:hypothetical protein FSP39_005778 [Pinctada imbricata]|uniref:Antistasin-like domain-containing protein n=1 Tax=Pinctada imbricata TaxID=66713 RepID=A0AA89BU54_PINIB|nr:hypothetical protein FSP39_005778 [Pinctada imbricata]